MLAVLRSTFRDNKTEIIAAVLVLLVSALIFTPMAIHWRAMGDAVPHVERAENLIAGDLTFMKQFPHILYPLSIAIPHQLFPGIGLLDFGVMVTAVLYVASTGIIYGIVRKMAAPTLTRRNILIAGGTALALMLVAPINVLTPDTLYFGYITPNVYHNPTVTLMKPLALLLFWSALRVYDSGFAGRHIGWMAIYAVLTVACIMAKPSFVIVLLPALAVVTLYRLMKRQHINWWLLVGGIVIPAGALLGLLSLLWRSSGVGFDPLRTFWEWSIHYDPNANALLLPKLLLSILFPLVVYAVYFRAAIKNLALNLAWAAFLFGAFYTYFLVELGDIPSGNMVWSAQSSLFILFVVSAVFVLRQNRRLLSGEERHFSRAFVLCAAVFALHLACGLIWYAVHMTSTDLYLVYNSW
jgi:hypothetical protein